MKKSSAMCRMRMRAMAQSAALDSVDALTEGLAVEHPKGLEREQEQHRQDAQPVHVVLARSSVIIHHSPITTAVCPERTPATPLCCAEVCALPHARAQQELC